MFLSSFVVLASFVMLNLVIAVILNNFVEAASDEGLLHSQNFFDILQRKMVLDGFSRRMHHKLKLYRSKQLPQPLRPPPSLVR